MRNSRPKRSASSLMRPRCTFFSSNRADHCSSVKPLSAYRVPSESDREITLPPRSMTLRAAYWATAVSGLEMSQNAMRLLWTAGEVDSKLHNIMQSIHHACVHYGEENGRINYVKGANIAGFVKVADAMLAQGIV